MWTDTKEGKATEGEAKETLSPGHAYERPLLTRIGNLHDLLAGGGTQNADPGGLCVTAGTGQTFDPTC
jgi:hypothetical protein